MPGNAETALSTLCQKDSAAFRSRAKVPFPCSRNHRHPLTLRLPSGGSLPLVCMAGVLGLCLIEANFLTGDGGGSEASADSEVWLLKPAAEC